MEILGSKTKTQILKSESHKLTEAFEVAKSKLTVTLSADMVAQDTLNILVDGASTGNIAFATDMATTAAAILAAIKALATVESATYASRVFTIVPVNQTNPSGFSSITHGGAGTATVATAYTDNSIKNGQPVKLDANGNLIPLANGNPFTTCIGYAMMDGMGGDDVTVALRGYAIIFAESAMDSLVPGPVKVTGYSSTNNRPIVSSDTISASNFMGYALDAADTGEEVRFVIS